MLLTTSILYKFISKTILLLKTKIPLWLLVLVSLVMLVITLKMAYMSSVIAELQKYKDIKVANDRLAHIEVIERYLDEDFEFSEKDISIISNFLLFDRLPNSNQIQKTESNNY